MPSSFYSRYVEGHGLRFGLSENEDIHEIRRYKLNSVFNSQSQIEHSKRYQGRQQTHG